MRRTGRRGRRARVGGAMAMVFCAALACSACIESAKSDSVPAALDLPTVPWEGGPSYWNSFAKAKAGGWADPSFFPVVAWYDSVSSPEEAAFDKSLGINTYIGMPETLDSSLLDDAGMFWIGGKLNDSFTSNTRSWVGYFLDDEVDGRYSPAEGRDHLAALRKEMPKGLFGFANFTSMILENDMSPTDAQKYVNGFTDVISVDKYWYTIPQCSLTPYRNPFLVPIAQAECRTASSYGRTIDALRQRDAVDGKLQPVWAFVENMAGINDPEAFKTYITPEQLEGAVMNSIIHEARGILYFNQSLAGPCQSANVFRSAETTRSFCGNPQVAAVKTVDTIVHQLAPVINTQSFVWNFGPGLDTMLKAEGGYAYVFAMTSAGSAPGSRDFQLPSQIAGRQIEVVNESRSLSADSLGRFTDSFDRESAFHIYKVKISP
ncbi:hypothetical protein [Sinomonas albida]|uniref:hypothetical protein n=1 Tax=Sinomonas albida TaxID=369942 RepID=UPI0030198A3D